MILSDKQITALCEKHKMIDPYEKEVVRSRNGQKLISYGMSSYGYDIRIADEFKIFTNVHGTTVDPKALCPSTYVDRKTDVCVIPPNSFLLAKSVEYIKMPRNVTGVVLCKSTYIRAGILIPTTVLEAGWEGIITLEISNVTPLPAKVYANEGIAQVLFYAGEDCAVSYADRGGKYQFQTGIVLPKV